MGDQGGPQGRWHGDDALSGRRALHRSAIEGRVGPALHRASAGQGTPRLVAYLAGVRETRAVHQWAEGTREIKSPEVEDRLRFALQVSLLLADHDSPRVVQAWFQGLNPHLEDRSPARLLREGDLVEVGPAVLGAARAFLVGG